MFMLKFDIITIFPQVFGPYFSESIIKRAQQKKLVKIKVHNLRDYTIDKHKTTDDRPFGGGPGMVMMVEPIYNCLKKLKLERGQTDSKTILLSPQGQQFNQTQAQELSRLKKLTLICGRYEGVDQRVADNLIDKEISIGDYILTGGELPGMVIVDAVTRLVPGVVKPESLLEESFNLTDRDETDRQTGRQTGNKTVKVLEYPQYTRPEKFHGWRVPDVLLSGNHQKIGEWRKEHCRNF